MSTKRIPISPLITNLDLALNQSDVAQLENSKSKVTPINQCEPVLGQSHEAI